MPQQRVCGNAVALLFLLYSLPAKGTEQPAETWPKLENGVFKQVVPSGKAERVSLGPLDIAFALCSHRTQEAVLIGGRTARTGMRSFVASNMMTADPKEASVNDETWGRYPDDRPLRSLYAGDTRQAMAPLLAHKALKGSYKWLVFGDDDTVFFTDAIRNLVQGFDHNMPYAISDNMWWSEHMKTVHQHPAPTAPRCLPCNYTVDVSLLLMKMASGCPCTPALMCSVVHGYKDLFSPQSCGIPRLPARLYSYHGAGGLLLSVGLMRNLDIAAFESCIREEYGFGADSFFTMCLWRAGFAVTDPDPLYFQQTKLTRFDPTLESAVADTAEKPAKRPTPDQNPVIRIAPLLGKLMQSAAGLCAAECQQALENTASFHVRTRKFGPTTSAMIVRIISRLYSKHYRPSGSQGKKRRPKDWVTAEEEGLADIFEKLVEVSIEDLKKQVSNRQPKPRAKAQEEPAAVLAAAQAAAAEDAAAGSSLRRLAAGATTDPQLWAADHRQRWGRRLSVSTEDVERLRREHKAAAAAGIAEELARSLLEKMIEDCKSI